MGGISINWLRVVTTLFCAAFLLGLFLFPLSAYATSSEITVSATTDTGTTVDLVTGGNITNLQMSNVNIATNQSAKTATLAFTLIGASGVATFSNISIPQTAVSFGSAPIVYIDGKSASSQGFTQDSNNDFVWYTTSFSNNGQSIGFGTHQISILFSSILSSPTPITTSSAQPNSNQTIAINAIAIVTIIAVAVAVILILRRRK
jgi:hypothetical protein